VILEDRLPPVATAHHMIDRSFIFQSQFAWHQPEYGPKLRFVSIVRTDPFTAIAGSKLLKILTSLRQTQLVIRTTSHLVCVVVVLAIIFPRANGTNLVASSLSQRSVTTARAAIQTPIVCSLLCDVGKGHGVTCLTNQTQPRRNEDVNRECGTETANRRWLQCLVRHHKTFFFRHNQRLTSAR